MLILIGLAVVFASILTGYMLEHGAVAVLLQPAELLIIGGSSAGTLLVANPKRNLARLWRLLLSVRTDPRYTRRLYLDALQLMYVIFGAIRRNGIAALEKHIEEPASSELFRSYPSVSKDNQVLAFICDSFRMVVSAGVDPEEIDRLMEIDISVQRAERQQPVSALMTVADSLPGLGIVAAVLGVVVTMQALGGPASEIGQKVAAALVGTFLGILLCYGVVGPLASHLEALNRGRTEYLQVLRIGIVAYLKGSSPILAAEYARRSIPIDVRPSFDAMETELRKNTRLPQAGGEPAEAAKTA